MSGKLLRLFPLEGKRCSQCEQVKPPEDFATATRSRDGLTSSCKACRSAANALHYEKNPQKFRERWLRYQYGLSQDDFDRLWEEQGGLCAVCRGAMKPIDLMIGRTRKGSSSFLSVAVDHDHASGKIRGLLHRRCNIALGYFWDNPEVLRRAAEYIEKGR